MYAIRSIITLTPKTIIRRGILLSNFHTTSSLFDSKKPSPPFVNKMFSSKPKDEDPESEEEEEDGDTTKTSTKNNNTQISKFKKLKKVAPEPKEFELEDKDLEEKFVIGSGPGGQHLNKTSTTCFLKHIPTGIFVKCNTTRYLPQNRKLARQMLKDKIDLLLNGKLSKIEKERDKIRKKKSKRRRRGFGPSSASDPSETENAN